MNRYLVVPAFLSILLLTDGCARQAAKVTKTAELVYKESSLSGPLPTQPFKSDGCSCWPDGDWLECCVRHDLLYWRGGTQEERKQADQELKKCVTEKGHPLLGQLVFLGVRFGGVWWLPTPFRWGFGWHYPDSGPPGTAY